MDPNIFIDRVIKKRRELLNGRILPEQPVSAFLAGMCCAMDAIETGGGDCCGWIPVGRNLPQEQTDPGCPEGLNYEVTLQKGTTPDTGFCRFQDGHWWKGNVLMDAYVTAWRKRSAPYEKEKHHG